MGRYRNYNNRSYYRNRSYGRERALEHIRQAKLLNEELGGSDEDVKNYFFSLSSSQLKPILKIYEDNHGSEAREYAEQTFHKWKSGKVQMSGMVAERLFSLLPPRMPIQSKYQLTESLWRHVGPSSVKKYYVGLDAVLDEVVNKVSTHLEEVVVKYKIPESMENRFNWLSHGDVNVKQDLLNYLRHKEKELLSEAIEVKLPLLIDHLSGENGRLTNHVEEILCVGKHEVRIVVTDKVAGITEKAPKTIYHSKIGDYSWIWWIIVIGFILWLLSQ